MLSCRSRRRRPAAFGVVGAVAAAWLGAGGFEAGGVLGGYGSTDEVGGGLGIDEAVLGCPSVHVGLSEAGEGQAVFSHQVEDGGGGQEMLADVGGLPLGGL